MIPIRDNITSKTTPYVSWVIMAICIAIFLVMNIFSDEARRQLIYNYGMVPIRYSNPKWAMAFGLSPDYYLSFLTNLFLHAGWLHIFINMWFMWIFAKNIENKMGHMRFLIFYLLCGLFATFVQWYFDSKLVIPVLGASGAIAGVLGAYFVISPFAKVVIWVPLFFLPIFFELPAIAFLGFWAIIQFQNATSSIVFDNITAGVAWWAHLGGFIIGALVHPLFITNFIKNLGADMIDTNRDD